MNIKLSMSNPRFCRRLLPVTAMLILALTPAVASGADYRCADGMETVSAGFRSQDHEQTGTGFEPISESFCDCCMEVYEIANDVPLTGINAVEGQLLRFHLDVPVAVGFLEFSLSGGTGDADVYVRRHVAPTLAVGDCGSAGGGNDETCWFTSPDPGDWYVLIQAHETFAGATLVASYDPWAGMDVSPAGEASEIARAAAPATP